jgi:hypothetical protein
MLTGAVASEIEAATRRCCACGGLRLLGDFRLRAAASGRRHSICRDCNAEYQRRRRAKRQGKKLDRFASDIHRVRERGFGRVAAVVNAVVREFGGMARLVERWTGHIAAAQEQGNHGLALKHLRSVLDVMIVMAPIEEQRRRDALANATDEQLQSAALKDLVHVLADICARDPVQREVVREALGL